MNAITEERASFEAEERAWAASARAVVVREGRALLAKGLSPSEVSRRTGATAAELAVTPADGRRGTARARPTPPGPPPSSPSPRRMAGAGPHDYMAALSTGNLFVDATYQRTADDRRIAKMSVAYDARLLGVLEVSARDDGRYAIIDGQHRWQLAMEVDARSADTPVVCHVHLGLTVEDEARLFHEIAVQRRVLGSWDKWKARRAAGDPVVLDVERIAADHGYRIGSYGKTPWTLQASGALEKIHARQGPEMLGRVLAILAAAGAGAYDWAGQPVIAGVADALKVYGEHLDDARFAEALFSARPLAQVEISRQLEQVMPGQVGPRVACMLVRHYNRQVLAAHRMPDYLSVGAGR